MNFGLALLADPADPTRKFASLQATADTAGFSGLDVLTIAATDLEVAINRGVRVPDAPATTTRINAVYALNLFSGTVGTLTFSHGGGTQTLTLTGSETDAALRASLTAKLAALPGIGAGT